MADFVATAEIDIEVSPGRVWRALTDPVQIKEYMFGSLVETDWKPGSPIVWHGEYEGKPYEDKGEIVEVEPLRLLVVTHFSPMSGQEDRPENYHKLRYELKPRGDGTHLSLSQDHNSSEDEAAHSRDNWSMMLASLKDVIERPTTRRADMFTADGKPSDDDPREHKSRLGDECTTLVESLRCQRLTLEMKCSGLDAEAMARRSVEPSTMSLLGLVRHLAEVERAGFRGMMSGQDVPRLFCSETDRDGDFDGAVADPQVVAEAWDAWRAEVDFATQFVAEAPSLDITGDDPLNQHGSGGGPMSLREVLVGSIEEYARHMGHADLLRERIDGRLGQ